MIQWLQADVHSLGQQLMQLPTQNRAKVLQYLLKNYPKEYYKIVKFTAGL